MQNLKKRNRTAFTVVELVIVIAVIAILAGVLIPTFGGIIKQANISADIQMAAQISTTLNMDLDGTKDAAELYKAVADTFGEDVANNFAPKSAKHGYHFWYDISNNIVVLAQYSELAELASPIAYANGSYSIGVADRIYLAESEEDEPLFEAGSLRTFDVTDDEKGDFYFMDKGGEIGEAMSRIEAGREVGATDEDKAAYDEALALLNEIAADSSNATQLLAEAILEKLGGISKVIDFDIKASGTGVKKASTEWHAAYNIIDLGLSAENFKYDTGIGTSTSVKWSYLPSAAETESGKTYASINEETGAVTLYPNNIIEAGASELTFKAVADAGVEDAEGNKYSETVTVCIDYPTDLNFTIGGGTYSIYDESLNITLSSKDNASFAFEFGAATLKIGDPDVGCDTEVNVVAGSGNLFSIAKSGDKYVLTVNDLGNYTEVSQDFTITVGSAIEETFTVTVTDRTAADYKLNAPFDEPKFLYRVGNGNAIPLRVFFNSEKPGDDILYIYDIVKSASTPSAPIGTGESLNATVGGETSANGSWAISALNWKDTEIKFSGTGTAKIKLGEVSIDVEVVDGNNVIPNADGSEKYITSPTAGTNVVLLTDVKIASGGKYNLTNSILFGNDFTFDVSNGNYSPGTYSSDNYVVLLHNSTLNNVRIEGKPFNAFSPTKDNADNICNVYATGNSVIANSYITNCASPVRLNGDRLEIVNSTLRGGSFANIELSSGHLILDNVTTINQKSVNGQLDSEGQIGLGIATWYEGVSNCKITIRNDLIQYNNLRKSDIESLTLGSISGSSVANLIFSNGNANFIYKDGNNVEWINAGILSLVSDVNADNFILSDFNGRPDKNDTHIGQIVSGFGFNGYLYSLKKDKISLVNPSEYISAGQYYITPSYSVDNSKNAQTPAEGSNDYCTWDETNKKVTISFDQGDSKVFIFSNDEFSFMTASKFDKPLSLSNVYLDGDEITDDGSITFDETGEHILEFVFDDIFNYGANGLVANKQFRRSVTIIVNEVAPEAKNATFDFNGNGYKQVVIGEEIYIMPNVSATTSTIASKTISGTTIYVPIVQGYTTDGRYSHSSIQFWQMCFPVFKNVITITDYENGGTGAAITYGASTTTLPDNLSVNDPANTFKYQSKNDAPTAPKNQNGVLCYLSPSLSNNARSEMDVDAIYTYTDNKGQTYKYIVRYHLPETTVSSGGICVTPDTLVTLADGTQKRIDELTYDDKVLAWDFEEGKYVSTGITVIVNHGYAYNDVIELVFEDGTTVKAVNGHGFFSAETNEWVIVDAANVKDFLGSEFVLVDGDTYKTAKLVNAVVTTEYVEAWGLVTDQYRTCISNGVFSITPTLPYGAQQTIFSVNDDMKYDAEQMQEDIEKYGLYAYEEFADMLTIEEFEAFNVAEFKIMVGKNYCTYEDVIDNIVGFKYYQSIQ